MALSTTTYPPNSDLDGVRFAMKDGGKIVPVLVTHEALQDIQSMPAQGVDYVELFNAYRPTFEAIAQKKYKTGQDLIMITTEDVV